MDTVSPWGYSSAELQCQGNKWIDGSLKFFFFGNFLCLPRSFFHFFKRKSLFFMIKVFLPFGGDAHSESCTGRLKNMATMVFKKQKQVSANIFQKNIFSLISVVLTELFEWRLFFKTFGNKFLLRYFERYISISEYFFELYRSVLRNALYLSEVLINHFSSSWKGK